MNLMHALNSILGQGVVTNGNVAAQQSTGYSGMLGAEARATRSSKTQTVFNGRINVEKVANGYVIHIAIREGYEFETYIASTIQEVNERIAASMVSFQLEGK